MANSRSIVCLLLLSCWYVTSVESNDQTKKQSPSTDQNIQESPLKSPIMFVPGDGGTQLEAKLNKPSRVHYLCDYQSDWFDLWLNIHLLVPLAIDCFVDNMKLTYNFTDRRTYNSPGVQIRPTLFGSLDSVDYLDIAHLPKTQYFNEIITKLISNDGYQRDKNMMGAGYDFRKAPNELEEFFVNLTSLIEYIYIENGYQRVTLICHSMGCLNSVHLLNGKSQVWKDTHIRRLISIAAPWSGSFKAIHAMLFGDNLGVYVLSSNVLQALQSTLPSLTYLFPIDVSWAREEVLIQATDKNYTLENFDEFFIDRSLKIQHAMWNDTKVILQNLTAPQVELWCLYSNGVQTPSKLIFDGPVANVKSNAKLLVGDGDGTVNIKSLSSCARWREDQKEPIYTHQFSGLDHVDVLRGDEVATFIATKIMPIQEGQNPESLKEYLQDSTDDPSLDESRLRPYKYSKRQKQLRMQIQK